MRPDRLIVGEVRGPEVFDMLQAMNSGHEGSLTTVHANSPEDALRRLENLVLLGGFELPSRAIRELLGATLHVVVQTTRFADGARRVTSIGEVRWSGEELTTTELYRFDAEPGGGAGGRHRATGARPRFQDRLVRSGWRPAAPAGSEEVPSR
jgi:pilus assembly protein CpaF